MFYPSKLEMQARDCEYCLFFSGSGRCVRNRCFIEQEQERQAEQWQSSQRRLRGGLVRYI